MAPPSRLSIATSSLQRLVKEESSYHKELEQQEARIKKLEQGSEDENAEFQLKQEVCRRAILKYLIDIILNIQRRALQETKAVFPSLKQRISDALAKLEQELVR